MTRFGHTTAQNPINSQEVFRFVSFVDLFFYSQEALVGVSGVGTGEESQPGSSRTLNHSPSVDNKFWVPPNLKRQASVCNSEDAGTSDGEFLVFCVCNRPIEAFFCSTSVQNIMRSINICKLMLEIRTVKGPIHSK
jgi:hypothetical protein